MCIGGSMPSAPAKLPEAPTMPDPTTGIVGDKDKKRKAAANDTILTSSRGTTQSGATATKTLLGE